MVKKLLSNQYCNSVSVVYAQNDCQINGNRVIHGAYQSIGNDLYQCINGALEKYGKIHCKRKDPFKLE